MNIISEKINEDEVKCLLCPHFCVLKKDEIGKCHARYSDGKNISHIKLGAISSLAVEPIEKKPFKHFLEGTKTLTWGSFSCNLNCKYCENFSISQSNSFDSAKVMSPSKLVEAAIKKHCKSISMSYNEPIISYEYLIAVAEECALNGLQFALKTNAFVNRDPWKEICLRTQAMDIDWKGDYDSFQMITRTNHYVLKDRIKEAYDYGVHIEISLPLYFIDLELENFIHKAGKFLSFVDKNIPCHLLRISPSYDFDGFIFDNNDMDKAKNILSEYMNNIYTVV